MQIGVKSKFCLDTLLVRVPRPDEEFRSTCFDFRINDDRRRRLQNRCIGQEMIKRQTQAVLIRRADCLQTAAAIGENGNFAYITTTALHLKMLKPFLAVDLRR